MLMIGDVLVEKEIELLGNTYIVYLKEVASKLGEHGKATSTTIRAFIRRGGKIGKSTEIVDTAVGGSI